MNLLICFLILHIFIMQKKTILFEQSYAAPTLDLYTIPVENGFAQSENAVLGISDWQNDGDGLTF